MRARRIFSLCAAFTALLFLGLIFVSFSAFVLLQKWIQLPRFIGLLHKSQLSTIAERIGGKHAETSGRGMERIQPLISSSCLNGTAQGLSSKEENDCKRKNDSFDFTMKTSVLKTIPAANDDAGQKVVNPSPLTTKLVNDTVGSAHASPPPTMSVNRSTLDPNKQWIQVVDMGSTGNMSSCNIFNGKWVLDGSYPLYSSRSCPFIDEAFDCEGNGRSDLDYTKWRWQPRYCNLLRFNATDMLERLRGKRLVFVGDSINRNQWESMLCLLSEAVPDKRRVFEARGRKITKEKGFYTFKFMDYRCTVEYYVTHFLVREGTARIGRRRRPTLRIDRIDKASSKWKGADILVFNSGHWWTHSKTEEGRNYYQEGDQVHPYLDVPTAYTRALMTWASWIDKHIDSRKTQVFFRSYSPSHFWGGQWNSGGRCEGEFQPIFNDTLVGHYPIQMRIVEEVIQQMKTPITFLNVTRLTEFRKDGHPSVHGKRPAEKKAFKSQGNYQDCSHWCLPGVPDAWNEMLYNLLVLKKEKNIYGQFPKLANSGSCWHLVCHQL